MRRRALTAGGLLWAAVLLTGVIGVSRARAQTSDQQAEQAVAEISSARERLNAASDTILTLQDQVETLVTQHTAMMTHRAVVKARLDTLRGAVKELALKQFVEGGIQPLAIVAGFTKVTDQVTADMMATLAAATSGVQVNAYEASASELSALDAVLTAQEKVLEQKSRELEVLSSGFDHEIEDLQAVEAQRLKDTAVAGALKAQQDDLRLRLRQQAAAGPAPVGRRTTPRGGGAIGATPGPAGGGTGRGAGLVTGCRSDCGYIDTSVICPVQGLSAFSDTWGDPRSGDRKHLGVDMLGPPATPIVAVVSGLAHFGQNTLGGNAVGLQGDNGNSYYYAHLSAFEAGAVGTVRIVQQGDVIGYRGDTGDAHGVPHLHFEVHPGGGPAVNPYPTAKWACG